ncbi:MAG: type II secretion system minor pseudopilin GspH [Steroidobacteraceae bacterium]
MTGTPPNRLPSLGAVRLPAGFTLIEILVVIVILGVVIAVATVSVGVLGRDREVEDQARRLWAVMTQGREEAELQGRDLGVFLDDTSYEFMMFDPKRSGWVVVEDDDLLARRELPEGLKMRLWLESREVVLKQTRAPTKDELKKRAPQIVMLASGEVMPYRLEIAREGSDASWRVQSQPDNTIVVEAADAAR